MEGFIGRNGNAESLYSAVQEKNSSNYFDDSKI